jgi:hypothetical protein
VLLSVHYYKPNMEAEQALTDNRDLIQVGLWMPPASKQKLIELAESDDRNMSSFMRRLIDAEYERVFGVPNVELIGKAAS